MDFVSVTNTLKLKTLCKFTKKYICFPKAGVVKQKNITNGWRVGEKVKNHWSRL